MKMEFDVQIKIENANDMQKKCVRLAELFAEAGEILGGINSGTCMECVAVDEIEQDEAFVFEPGKKFEFGGLEWVALDEVDGGGCMFLLGDVPCNTFYRRIR